MKTLKTLASPFIGIGVLVVVMIMVLIAPTSETPFNGWDK
jgi:hypothetical protein